MDVVLSLQGWISELATNLVPDTFSKANAVVATTVALVIGGDEICFHTM
jgi:hypothetical protein